MSIENVLQILDRRPEPNNLREQLFWLVDLVYACKGSGDPVLTNGARIAEDALGSMGTYLESGDAQALDRAMRQIEDFSRVLQQDSGVTQAKR